MTWKQQKLVPQNQGNRGSQTLAREAVALRAYQLWAHSVGWAGAIQEKLLLSAVKMLTSHERSFCFNQKLMVQQMELSPISLDARILALVSIHVSSLKFRQDLDVLSIYEGRGILFRGVFFFFSFSLD